MKNFIVIALLASVAAKPAREARSGIVGGEDAKLKEFPYQVRVTIEDEKYMYLCGGTIIREDIVMTAAHCVNLQKIYFILVEAGIITGDEESRQEKYVKSYVMNKHYISETDENDIAMLRLDESFTFNDYVNAGTLPTQGQIVTGDCIATGWGNLSEHGHTSKTLQKVTVPVVSDAKCQRLYPLRTITDTMLCAGYDKGLRDACSGDSGGPLMCGDVIGGIISWGTGCARPMKPGVYTEVVYFIDWINANIEKSPEDIYI